MDKLKLEGDGEKMTLHFIMTLARMMKIKPEDFAKAAANQHGKESLDYLTDFTIAYAAVAIKAMAEDVAKKNK